ncbi:MAG: type I CRISPR-associated protein Cas8a1/Csx8 [Eubacteriaceae bacterium]
MKSYLENGAFDTRVDASDWRYSAAIVGLMKYFETFDFDYVIVYDDEMESEYLYYNQGDLTKETFIKFIEMHYGDELYHIYVKAQLQKIEFTEDEIKVINEKLQGNTSMKKVFSQIKFNGTNQSEILNRIEKEEKTLTLETFRNKKNMYANFANTKQLLKEKQETCRLVGYTIDIGKKGKSNAYNFNTNTFVGYDDPIFDWIPFAFVGERESFFINDNYSIKELYHTNLFLKNKVKEDLMVKLEDHNRKPVADIRKALFKTIIESADFIDFDVEIIYKDRAKKYFETLYIRKESIEILRKIEHYEVFCFSLKVTDDYYINVQKKVIEAIINLLLVDELIELFLKDNRSNGYVVKELINLNLLIRKGGAEMKKSMKVAYACGKAVAEKKEITNNKLDGYRQKLTSAIVFKDYDRVCQILLQLSNYSGVQFDFAYDLFENFEDNKDLAYTFINALRRVDSNKNTQMEEK